MNSLTKLQEKLKFTKLLSSKAIDPAIKKAGMQELGETNIHDAIFAVLEEQSSKIEELKKMLSVP